MPMVKKQSYDIFIIYHKCDMILIVVMVVEY